MIVITTPPDYTVLYDNYYKVFLGGGIGGCPDWQKEFIKEFKYVEPKKDVQLFNPRWEYKWTAFQQIEWEYKMINASNLMIMWFAKGGQNRICFYELGKYINAIKTVPAVVGCDPDFDRKDDVAIQTHLARPDLNIKTNISDLAIETSEKIDDCK